MNFGMIILNQNIEIRQNCAIQILIALLFTLRLKILRPKDISDDIERWFETSNYNENDKIPLPIGKNKKVSGLFKNELGGKIITEVIVLRAKTYSYLIDGYDDYENNKKEIKKLKEQKSL